MANAANSESRVLRLKEVILRTGLSRSTIYQRAKDNSFPKQIILGARSVGWVERDIERWIQSRISSSQHHI